MDLHTKALERSETEGARMESRIKDMQSSLAPVELRPETRCSSHVEGHNLNIPEGVHRRQPFRKSPLGLG